MKSEAPGPQVGKIVSKIKVTARILYVIYAVITVIEVILLICGGIGALGPGGTFACLSPVSTLFLGIVMLVGRLEIFPILMLFSRRTWQVRKFN